jgi:hypothetical protein
LKCVTLCSISPNMLRKLKLPKLQNQHDVIAIQLS